MPVDFDDAMTKSSTDQPDIIWPVRHQTMDTVDGHVCESKIIDARGKVVGFCAYGHYDLAYPYVGQKPPETSSP